MKKSILIGIVVVGILVLAGAYYLVSPLFIDKEVNEDIPIEGDVNNSAEDVQEETEEDFVYSGNFIDADTFHKTSGVAKVIGDEEYLRFENFQTTNGPDLYVYLAKDLDAEEFVNLGRLKGNIGNQNYEIAEDVNLEEYTYVLIWCRAFGVLFGSAELE